VSSPDPATELNSAVFALIAAVDVAEANATAFRGEAALGKAGPSGPMLKRELVVPEDTPANCCKTEATSRSRLSFFFVTGLWNKRIKSEMDHRRRISVRQNGRD
jgi:hypothetical protein